jgi:hypothetical protein
MRTHLLRTFYPSPAAEPDTGSAANDAEYDASAAVIAPAARVTLLAVAPRAGTLSREDEYALGGYAGI